MAACGTIGHAMYRCINQFHSILDDSVDTMRNRWSWRCLHNLPEEAFARTVVAVAVSILR